MLSKLDQLANRLVELDELLMTEGVTANMDSYRKMTREHAELAPLVAVYRQYESALANTAEAQDMLHDPEMKDFAQEEIEAAKVQMAALEQELQKMLLPKDAEREEISRRFLWRSQRNLRFLSVRKSAFIQRTQASERR